MKKIGDRAELAKILESMGEDEDRVQARIAAGLIREGFDVAREVTSQCGRSRIDIVARKGDFCAGIEIKLSGQKRGKDLGAWLKQAMRYSGARFVVPQWSDDPVEMKIYVFPQLSGLYLDEGELMHEHSVLAWGSASAQHNVSTMLGSLGLGELQIYRRVRRWRLKRKPGKYGLQFVFKGKVMWHTDVDVDNQIQEERKARAELWEST